MQFSTTFPLLSLAAYVRAQCTGRPDTVDGQAFTYVCSWNGENFCHYTGGDEGAGTIGPLCVYWVRVARPRSISCARQHLVTSMAVYRRILGLLRLQ
ncbi:hypothetical protein EDD16DRAFT_991948 [Pisolithus croceorrhizus]|nr:hypothetical protein EDD16DRAFT_991948 [Pisolithus croceorrhizus]